MILCRNILNKEELFAESSLPFPEFPYRGEEILLVEFGPEFIHEN
jgi:hypothetical protein